MCIAKRFQYINLTVSDKRKLLIYHWYVTIVMGLYNEGRVTNRFFRLVTLNLMKS